MIAKPLLIGAVTMLTMARPAWSDDLNQAPFATPNADPRDNLAQFWDEFRCHDPAQTDPWACPDSDPYPRTEKTPVTWRRADWGSNGAPYYEISENYELASGAGYVQSGSFAPWRGFVAAHGDGADYVVIEHDRPDVIQARARAYATEAGQSPVIQWINGPECGWNGWVEADINVPLQDGWSGYSTKLGINTAPYGDPFPGCAPAAAPGYDEWTWANITYPFIVFGRLEQRTILSVVSCHVSPGSDAECLYHLARYGTAVWQAFAPPGSNEAPTADIAQRCPVFGLGAPWPGYRLVNCRMFTQIIVAPPGWTGAQFGWGPS